MIPERLKMSFLLLSATVSQIRLSCWSQPMTYLLLRWFVHSCSYYLNVIMSKMVCVPSLFTECQKSAIRLVSEGPKYTKRLLCYGNLVGLSRRPRFPCGSFTFIISVGQTMLWVLPASYQCMVATCYLMSGWYTSRQNNAVRVPVAIATSEYWFYCQGDLSLAVLFVKGVQRTACWYPTTTESSLRVLLSCYLKTLCYKEHVYLK